MSLSTQAAPRTMYQDECFTPKKKLQRSPPFRGGKENGSAVSKDSVLVVKQKTTPLGLNNGLQNTLSIRPDSSFSLKSINREKAAPNHEAERVPSEDVIRVKLSNSSKGEKREDVENQASCFTPQKSLRRSPPPAVKGNIMVNAVPPIRRWELPRTPDTSAPPKELPPTPVAVDMPATSDKELSRIPVAMNMSALISHKELSRTPVGVESACPTSHKELSRTPVGVQSAPPILHKELPHAPVAVDTLAFNSCKELPRTPVAMDLPAPSKKLPAGLAPPTSLDISTNPKTTSGSQHARMPVGVVHTPVAPPNIQYVQLSPMRSCLARVKPPRHPLCQSNRASPGHSLVTSAAVAPQLTQGSLQPVEEKVARRLKSLVEKGPALDQEIKGSHQQEEVQLSVLQEESVSPPIAVCKGASSLPGLKCTKEDLAFLQYIDHQKQYKALQAQNEHLLKLRKGITEEKEQLEHTAIKVKSDLDEMKEKYRETVSTANDLIANLSLLGTNGELGGEHQLESDSSGQHDLNQAKIARLKKLAQLGSVQVEKIAAKLKAKSAELDKTKQALQHSIRHAMDRDMQRRTELESKIKASTDERSSLERKFGCAADKNASAKADIESLQSELAKLELSCNPKEPAAVVLSEKRKVEERLKMIALGCELYVQRHEMQKKLRTIN